MFYNPNKLQPLNLTYINPNVKRKLMVTKTYNEPFFAAQRKVYINSNFSNSYNWTPKTRNTPDFDATKNRRKVNYYKSSNQLTYKRQSVHVNPLFQKRKTEQQSVNEDQNPKGIHVNPEHMSSLLQGDEPEEELQSPQSVVDKKVAPKKVENINITHPTHSKHKNLKSFGNSSHTWVASHVLKKNQKINLKDVGSICTKYKINKTKSPIATKREGYKKLYNTPRNSSYIVNNVKNSSKKSISLVHKSCGVVNKTALSVKSKYKIIKHRRLSNEQKVTNIKVKKRSSKYRVDNRQRKLSTSKSLDDKTKRKLLIRSRYTVNNVGVRYKQWKNLFHYRSRVDLMKLTGFSRTQSMAMKKDSRLKSVTNMSGFQYRTTNLTLKRTRTSSRQKTSFKPGAGAKRNYQVLNILGQKYIMNYVNQTLSREKSKTVQENRGINFNRIDVGGVTFKRKDNVYVKTNTHTARNVVHIAKQRSIAFLKQQRTKNNMPCMMYHRFGRCTKQSRGKCPYLHKPENIAICKKFLNSICEDKDCLLSHNLAQEKMPTCQFFLNGYCSRENCPYLHVKVNSKASVCRDFLNGFCQRGKACKKRHEFEKAKASQQKYISKFPRTSRKSGDKRQRKVETVENSETKEDATIDAVTEETEYKRYYTTDLEVEEMVQRDEGEDECLSKRLKLDYLASYVPLH